MEKTHSDHTDFDVDEAGFLIQAEQWTRHFAEEKASDVGIPKGLTREHWDVIDFIRKTYEKSGRCPLIFETCRQCGLTRHDLKRLFPAGYLRGACKLAGVTYREGYLSQSYLPRTGEDIGFITSKKVYLVDVRGFLINSGDWDEYFAAYRAFDMKIPGGGLTDDHWRIIKYMRKCYTETGKVPTVYDACDDNKIELDELERLFPDGYHRGLVKIAGLRVR